MALCPRDGGPKSPCRWPSRPVIYMILSSFSGKSVSAVATDHFTFQEVIMLLLLRQMIFYLVEILLIDFPLRGILHKTQGLFHQELSLMKYAISDCK